MGIQEMAVEIMVKTFKTIGIILVLLYKLVIKPFLIPAVQHGIKHGWIFIPLGVIIAGIMHIMLFEIFSNINISDAIIHLIAIPVYCLFIYCGIILRRWKLDWNNRQEGGSVYINPDVPEDLYEDD